MRQQRPTSEYPDEALDCELTVEGYIQDLLDSGVHLGWDRSELKEAILTVSSMMQLAEEPNAGQHLGMFLASRKQPN